ncbi:hypothetical protein TNCV_447011 [Trichonephila clavipes]|nr:hypothetical protein TNCV_447011 [Trichonephila clavipes]
MMDLMSCLRTVRPVSRNSKSKFQIFLSLRFQDGRILLLLGGVVSPRLNHQTGEPGCSSSSGVSPPTCLYLGDPATGLALEIDNTLKSQHPNKAETPSLRFPKL